MVQEIPLYVDPKETSHSRDLEPSTQANDWWPLQERWTTIDLTFTTGYKKEYRRLSDIEIV